MTMTETTVQDGIAILRLDRPKVLNAINEAMVGEIEAAFDRVEQDDAIRAMVIVGTGRAFCVGSDLKEGGSESAEERIARMHRLMLRIVEFPKITVAAFNGLALGGGLEIGLACVMRVAATEARMGLPEVTHSLMPTYGGTQLLPRVVGLGQALQMALTGEMIDAARAEAIGLVSVVAPDALEAAITLADRASRGGRLAQLEIRKAMIGGINLPLAEGLALEAACGSRIAASDEAKAAVNAFTKR